MKKIIIIIVVCILVLGLAGGAAYYYTDWFRTPTPLLKGPLSDKDTGTASAYSLEILKYDEIENQYIKNWIVNNKDRGVINGNNVYYSLCHNDLNAPLEVYIYMPNAREVLGDIDLSNIKITESGTALMMYIDTPTDISRVKDGTELILHIYVADPNSSTKAKTERLIINGKTYTSHETISVNLK